MPILKLIEIGDSVGVILPPELLDWLKCAEGDALLWSVTAQGVLLTRDDQVPNAQLPLGREFMDDYRDTFRGLDS
nr:AbrB/MazE/SpoVT family DNA-binding domain-containing protein [uncultured Albidiferax sp.]